MNIKVTTAPITVAIAQGTVAMIGDDDAYALDAEVFDRDEGQYTLGYQWSITPAPADSTKVTGDDTKKLTLGAGAFVVGKYTATVTVTKPNTPPVQASISIVVKKGSIPVVSITRKVARCWM